MFTGLSIEALVFIMQTRLLRYELRQAAWRELCLRCACD